MSISNIPSDNQNHLSIETQPLEIETRLEFLNTRFYFHDLFKKDDKSKTKHYIVEDMEYDLQFMGEQESHVFYYLKQNIYNSEKVFKHAKEYYLNLYDYCQSRFVKNDIVKMNFIYFFEDKKVNYYEIVTVYEYGETDRIDVENIEPHHILKFLKNFAGLLQDLKKFKKISHNNLDINNIILVNNELKISGFKPFYIEKNTPPRNWRQEIVQNFGVYRYDLFLIGLLWLKFLNIKFSFSESAKLESVKKQVKTLITKIPSKNTMGTIENLLDLEKKKDYTVEQLLIEFDEDFILKTVQQKEVSPQNNQITKKDSLQSNLFMKSYHESENVSNYIFDKNIDNKKKENFIRIGDDFTLKPQEEHINDFITIRDIRGSTANLRSNIIDQMEDVIFQPQSNYRKSLDPNIDSLEIIKNKFKSESNLLYKKDPKQNPFVKIKEEIMQKKENHGNFDLNDFQQKNQFLKFNDNQIKNTDVFLNIESKINLARIEEENESNKDNDFQSPRDNYLLQTQQTENNNYESFGNLNGEEKNFTKKHDINQQVENENDIKIESPKNQKNNKIVIEEIILENKENKTQKEKKKKKKEEEEEEDKKKKIFKNPENPENNSNNNNRIKRKDFQAKLEKTISENVSKSPNKKIKSQKKSNKKVETKIESTRNPSQFEMIDKKTEIIKKVDKNSKSNKKEEYPKVLDDKKKIEMKNDNLKLSRKNIKTNNKESKEKLDSKEISDLITQQVLKNDLNKKSNQNVKSKVINDRDEKEINEEKKKLNVDYKNEIGETEKKNFIEENKTQNAENEKKIIEENKNENVEKDKYNPNQNNEQKNEKVKNDQKDDFFEDKDFENKKEIPKISEKKKAQQILMEKKIKEEREIIEKEIAENELQLKMNRDKITQEIKKRVEETKKPFKYIRLLKNDEEEEKIDEVKNQTEIAKKIVSKKEIKTPKKLEEKIVSKKEIKTPKKLEEKIVLKKEEKKESIDIKTELVNEKIKEEQLFFEEIILKKKEMAEEEKKLEISSRRDIDFDFNKPRTNSYLENYQKSIDSKFQSNKKVEKNSAQKSKKEMSFKIENKFTDNNPIENTVFTPTKSPLKDNKYETDFVYLKKINEDKTKKDVKDILKDENLSQESFDLENDVKNQDVQKLNDIVQKEYSKNAEKKIQNTFEEKSEKKVENPSNDNKTLLGLIYKSKTPKKYLNNVRDNTIKASNLPIIKKKEDDISIVDLNSNGKKSPKRRVSKNLDKSDLFSIDEVSVSRLKNNKNDEKSRLSKIEFKLKTKIPVEKEQKQFSTVYLENISFLKKMLEENKLNEAIELLNWMLDFETGQKKIDTYKTLGIVLYKNKLYEKSILVLYNGLDYLQNTSLINKDHQKRVFLINLAISQIANNQPQNALNSLLDPIFENKDKNPFAYFPLLGDSYYLIKNYTAAFEAYNEQLKKFNKNILSEKLVENIILISNKIVKTLLDHKDEELFVSFFKYLIEMVDRMIKTEETYSGTKNNFSFKEKVFLDLIDLIFISKNDNLLNYALHNVIEKKLINLSNMDEIQKKKFLKILIDFGLYLKGLNNYGNQKKSFECFFNKATEIIENSTNNIEVIKQKLMIYFNLGIFHIGNEDYEKAEKNFHKCLTVYKENIGNADFKVFVLLFNLAEKIYKKKKYSQSCYYFEQILQSKNIDVNLQKKSLLYLVQNYYIIGDYEKGIAVIENFILKNIEEDNTEYQESLNLFLNYFFVFCMKTHSPKFGVVMKALKENIELCFSSEKMHYLFLYYNLSQFYFKKKNLKENMELIAKMEKINSFTKIFTEMSLIYNEIIMEKKNEQKNLLCCLYDENLNINQNAENIKKFILDFYFIFYNGILILTKSNYDNEIREKLNSEIQQDHAEFVKFIKEKLGKEVEKNKFHGHDHLIENVERFYIGTSTKSVQSRLFSLRDINFLAQSKQNVKKNGSLRTSIDFSRNSIRAVNKTPEKILEQKQKSPKFNGQSKFNSSRNVVKNSEKNINIKSIRNSMNFNNTKKQINFEKDSLRGSTRFNSVKKQKEEEIFKLSGKCECRSFVENHNCLSKIVFNFFKEIKNIINGKSFNSVNFYFKRLQNDLKKNILNFEKFSYVEKIINLLEQKKSNLKQQIDLTEFQTILRNKEICLHDLENILLLLETSKNSTYLEEFLFLIEENSEKHFRMLVQKYFLEDLQKKVDSIKNVFIKKLDDEKIRLFLDTPFYHLINYKKIEEKIKLSSVSNIIIKKRYEILKNKKTIQIVQRETSGEDFANFELNLTFLFSLFNLNKTEKGNLEIYTKYEKSLTKILNNNPKNNLLVDFYNFYILNLSTTFTKSESVVFEKIIEILELFKKKLENESLYHFAIVCSKIGNLFFRHKMWIYSSKCKSIAFESLKNMPKSKIDFPKFIPPVSPHELLFEIFEVLFVNQIELNEKNMAFNLLNKLRNFTNNRQNSLVKVKLCEMLFAQRFKENAFSRPEVFEDLGNFDDCSEKILLKSVFEILKFLDERPNDKMGKIEIEFKFIKSLYQMLGC